jgi:hypothetical protein
MKRFLAAWMAVGMLTGPAYSQHKTPLEVKYENEERQHKETERAYEAQMKRLRSQPSAPATTARDPWAGVRPAPEPNSKR